MVQKQQLRRSQFVLVYGPGAIIEGPNGSRLIPSFEGLGEKNCDDSFFKKYEVKDIRMNHLLDDGQGWSNHLISIPPNTSIADDEPPVIYSTVVFPAWHICYERNPPILYFDKFENEHCQAYDEEKCINCKKSTNPNVRFIRACPNGHMDEVNWPQEVHLNGSKDCNHNKFFYWKANGSTLEEIEIICPICKSKTNIRQIYRKIDCTGRLPETEELEGNGRLKYTKAVYNNCTEQMSVIQKQSTSLRLAVTKTLLRIPEYDEPVMDSLINKGMEGFIFGKNPSDVTEEEILKATLKFAKEDYDKVKKYFDDGNTVNDYFDIYNRVDEREHNNFSNAIDEEFNSLRKNHTPTKNFSKSKPKYYDLDVLRYNFPLKVFPIEKLTTITAQISYQRKPHPKKRDETDDEENFGYINIGYEDEKTKKRWYPAFEGVGEGIFITSDENPFSLIPNIEETRKLWENNNLPKNKDRPEITSPLFVWWHTLSHALIKSLSLSCGYSSTSLRERVYIDDLGRGGVLIYNTSPGDDSGMGGLVDVVYNRKEFNRVLENAMNTIRVCSNDPLCSSVKLGGGAINGSACHNCLLISETSCEHLNTLLDRHFFIGD